MNSTKRRHNEDQDVALDWLKQLQDRGESRSLFGAVSEADMLERMRNNPDVLGEMGKNIDLQKEAIGNFTSSKKHYFKSYVDEIASRLNGMLRGRNGSLFPAPIIDVLQGPSLSPVQQRVFTTDSEIILIPAELMHLSNLISRSLTMILNPRKSKNGDIIVPPPSGIELNDVKRRRGITFLSMIIYCHISFGESFLVPLPPIGKRHEPLRSLLLEAMETFAIAHEYGHIVADHSERTPDTEVNTGDLPPHILFELEADIIGQTLCKAVGHQQQNPLLICNIGGVVLLHIGEYIRQANSILKSGKMHL